MIEIKDTKSRKVTLKGLCLQGNDIIDEDGCLKDLNKIIATAFTDDDIFDLTVTSKTNNTEVVEEG